MPPPHRFEIPKTDLYIITLSREPLSRTHVVYASSRGTHLNNIYVYNNNNNCTHTHILTQPHRHHMIKTIFHPFVRCISAAAGNSMKADLPHVHVHVYIYMPPSSVGFCPAAVTRLMKYIFGISTYIYKRMYIPHRKLYNMYRLLYCKHLFWSQLFNTLQLPVACGNVEIIGLCPKSLLWDLFRNKTYGLANLFETENCVFSKTLMYLQIVYVLYGPVDLCGVLSCRGKITKSKIDFYGQIVSNICL